MEFKNLSTSAESITYQLCDLDYSQEIDLQS